MTRSSSPNGAVEFSYEFPRASTSALPVPSPRRPRSPQSHTLRRPSPTRHYHSDIDDDGVDDNDEFDYDAYGYPHVRTQTLPVPLPHTGNQWAHLHRAPQPSYAFPSSFDSDMSALSSAASQSQGPARTTLAPPKKIRKPHHLHTRASLDEPPSSHSYSYSYTSSQDIYDEPSSYGSDFDVYEHDADADAEDDEVPPESSTSAPCPTSLRRQWAALSLRVRFGVFRAKRRIRMHTHTIARVTSL